jgi:hypothetical protein
MPATENHHKTIEALYTDTKRAFEDQCAVNTQLRGRIEALERDAQARETDYGYAMRRIEAAKVQLETFRHDMPVEAFEAIVLALA